MIDCEEMFKDHCHQLTKSYPSYSTDLVVEKELLRSFIDYGQDTCVHHKDEERRIICLECRDVICVRCLIESHQSHLWSDLEEIVQRFRKFAGCDDDAISGCLRQCRDRKRKLNDDKAEFLAEVAVSEKAIVKTGQNLKDLIDRHTQVLVDELSQLKMRKLVEMETERQEVEKELKILELCYSDLATKLPQNDLYHSNHSCVVSRSEEENTRELLTEQEIYRHSATMIAFQEAEILEQLKENGCNLLGRLKAEFDLLKVSTEDCKDWTLIDFPEFRSTANEEDRHVTVQLMALLDTDDWNVFGVAAMRSNLYVLLCNSIIIYDAKEPFSRVGEIKAPQFLYPFDMAACPRTLCLYVTDDGHRCLWRVDSDHQVSRWIDGLAEPSTVSVSAQTGQVTIVRSGLPRSILEVFDPTGELVHSIQLPDFVVEPQHAIVTSLGDTILCYRQCRSKTWGLCRLDSDGEIVVKCELKDTFHHLAATPCHLALDELDRVFVADWQKKIDLFDSELNWDRTLVSSRGDGIERPERLCFDRINGLLLVVHAWGKKTYVYKFIATNIPDNGRKRVNRW